MTQAGRSFKGALRLVLRLVMTLAVIAASAAMVAAGRSALAQRAVMADAPAAAAPPAVQVARIALRDGYAVGRAFTGQIEPAQRTAAGFEFGGTVTEILVDEGDAVAQGAPMARLDARLLEAERDRLAAARRAVAAQAELAARTTDRQSALQARGIASPQALDAASLGAAEMTARMAEIDASLAAVAIRLEKAVLYAPFAGLVAARHVDLGASVDSGQPVVSLVETAGPVFRVGLAPDAVRAIPADGRVAIRFDDGARQAWLRSILPDLDAATRTRTALFRIEGANPPAWRSAGSLSLTDHVAARGAWVPLAALEVGPRGLWRILTVVGRDGANVVGTEAVEILHAEAGRAYVRGTIRDGAVFVTEGAHRVTPGQAVRPLGPAE